MWIYTNSPNTPDYLTPGQLYKHVEDKESLLGSGYIKDDKGRRRLVLTSCPSGCAHLGDDHWHILSDYNSKHLEG